MSNLLITNYMRLWKDKIFYCFLLFMGVAGLYNAVSFMFQLSEPGVGTLSNVFFKYTIYILVLSSIFCSLFVGTEYSNGTLRNKIIMGHSRQKIYFANLITCISANLIMCLAYIVTSLAGISMGFATAMIDTFVGVLCSFAVVCSVSSLFTMITMLSKRKSIATVICIVIAFLLVLYGMYVRDTTLIAQQQGKPNMFYEFLNDFLPGCQMLQLSLDPETTTETSPIIIFIYAFFLFIITTTIGLSLFKKKDLQ